MDLGSGVINGRKSKENHNQQRKGLEKRLKLEKILPQYGHQFCYGTKSHRDPTEYTTKSP
jgi:hypothetical protein